MTKLAVVLAVALPLGLALPSGAHAEDRGAPLPPVDEQPVSGGSRGYVKAPPSAFADNHGPISHIIYANRCRGGCTFTKGTFSDAITNTTIIGPGSAGTTFTLSEFAQSEQVWNDAITCLREAYAPYDVQIVTDDPGNVPHHEAIIAGTSAEIGRAGEVLGVAPLDASTCEPKNNVISFSLANSHPADGLYLCWTIAQETAHSYGLDHAFECTDPMTYIPTPCGQKFFRNKLSPCGENGPRQCLCSGTTQNSHAKLLSVHGANPTPAPAPTTTISSPANGATVSGEFSVVVGAVDKRGIDRIEVYVNGWKWNQVAGSRNSSYLVPVPAAVPNGVMDVKIRACNDIDRCGEQTVQVTKGAPCANADACALGQKCEAGKCFWDPPSAELGEACTYPQACISENCQSFSDGTQVCTQACFGGPNDDCPDGFTCSGAVGQAGFCLAGGGGDDGGGCCSAGDDGTGAVALNLGLGGLVGLLVLRRRRARA